MGEPETASNLSAIKRIYNYDCLVQRLFDHPDSFYPEGEGPNVPQRVVRDQRIGDFNDSRPLAPCYHFLNPAGSTLILTDSSPSGTVWFSWYNVVTKEYETVQAPAGGGGYSYTFTNARRIWNFKAWSQQPRANEIASVTVTNPPPPYQLSWNKCCSGFGFISFNALGNGQIGEGILLNFSGSYETDFDLPYDFLNTDPLSITTDFTFDAWRDFSAFWSASNSDWTFTQNNMSLVGTAASTAVPTIINGNYNGTIDTSKHHIIELVFTLDSAVVGSPTIEVPGDVNGTIALSGLAAGTYYYGFRVVNGVSQPFEIVGNPGDQLDISFISLRTTDNKPAAYLVPNIGGTTVIGGQAMQYSGMPTNYALVEKRSAYLNLLSSWEVQSPIPNYDPLPFTSDWEMEILFKENTGSLGAQLFGWGFSPASGMFYINGSESWECSLGGNTQGVNTAFYRFVGINLGAWDKFNLVWTSATNTFSFYRWGKLVGEKVAVAAAWNNFGNFTIGGGDFRGVDGAISYCKIWNNGELLHHWDFHSNSNIGYDLGPLGYHAQYLSFGSPLNYQYEGDTYDPRQQIYGSRVEGSEFIEKRLADNLAANGQPLNLPAGNLYNGRLYLDAQTYRCDAVRYGLGQFTIGDEQRLKSPKYTKYAQRRGATARRFLTFNKQLEGESRAVMSGYTKDV